MKLFERIFAVIPLGIGLAVLGDIWFGQGPGFGRAPVMFQLIGSCVALGFILVGIGGVTGILSSQNRLQDLTETLREVQRNSRPLPQKLDLPPELAASPAKPVKPNYACANCGAPLGQQADVSPLGDAKCEHCNRWFNIHQKV